ncbi:epithelial sodium channel subunit gamma-like [Lycorma delicatula]|uniref:epithelial sodium channel subunit gamma-like n=1 Tax=Lycorma delicatula TaxID=130591 RepID=UPI003F51A6F7
MMRNGPSSVQGFCCISRNTVNFKTPHSEKEPVQNSKLLDYYSNEKGSINWNSSVACKELGLKIELVVEPEEYQEGAYSYLNTYAAKVLIYDSHIYPDVPSGGVLQTLIPYKHEVFLHMLANAEYSVLNMATLSASNNGCKIHSDESDMYNSEYSFSGCLFKCRMKTLTEKCGCTPIYIPHKIDKLPYCRIEDMACVHDQREKWAAVNLGNNNESCQCNHACNHTIYSRHTTLHPITSESLRSNDGTIDGNESADKEKQNGRLDSALDLELSWTEKQEECDSMHNYWKSKY